MLRAVEVGGLPIAIINVDGTLHAISDFCPHEGLTLTAGYGIVRNGTVICMMHTSLFDLKTGDVLGGPADSGLMKYAVHVDGDEVFVATQASS